MLMRLAVPQKNFTYEMHEALEGLQSVYCIADDILVVGQSDMKEEAKTNIMTQMPLAF